MRRGRGRAVGRPAAAFAPNNGNNDADTRAPSMRSGTPLPVRLKLAPIVAATSVKTWLSARMSRYWPVENQSCCTPSPGDRCQRMAMRPASS